MSGELLDGGRSVETMHSGVARRSLIQGALAATAVFLGGCTASRAVSSPASRVYRLGFLSTGEPSQGGPLYGIRDRLRELGYVEGRNLVVEVRHASGIVALLPDAASQLVQTRPDVIVGASTSTAVQAAMQATGTIPIVFVNISGPVEQGIVASMARPGGNVTGVTGNSDVISAKRVEFLAESIPNLARVGVFWSSNQGGSALAFRETEAACRALGIEVTSLDLRSPDAWRAGIQEAIDQGAQAVIELMGVPFANDGEVNLYASAIAEARLPSTHFTKARVARGALMSYSADYGAQYRRAAEYVDLLFRGANPAETPVDQAREFEFVVDVKNAHELGLTVPQHVLLEATDVLR